MRDGEEAALVTHQGIDAEDEGPEALSGHNFLLSSPKMSAVKVHKLSPTCRWPICGGLSPMQPSGTAQLTAQSRSPQVLASSQRTSVVAKATKTMKTGKVAAKVGGALTIC
jgi:hypothetical protein